MISTFLKKLLFARQFSFTDGKIDILGKGQVMVSTELSAAMEKLINKPSSKKLKEIIKKDMGYYLGRLSNSEEGIIRNLADIFELYGIGRIEFLDIDYKNKKATIRIHKNNKKNQKLAEILVSVIVSVLFNKDVDARKSNKGLGEFDEYVIR